MGFKFASRVYEEVRDTDGTAQAVLAYLAFRADDRNGLCHPSRETIVAKTHFSRSAVQNALNRLRDAGRLMWVQGGRHKGKGGRSLANDYLIVFDVDNSKAVDDSRVSRDSQEACAGASREPVQGLAESPCRGHEMAPVIKDHNLGHKLIRERADDPIDRIFRQEVAAIGASFRAERPLKAPPALRAREQVSVVDEVMRICGVRDSENKRAFSKVMLLKDKMACLEVAWAYESELRQGEHVGIRNHAANLMKRIQSLPDRCGEGA